MPSRTLDFPSLRRRQPHVRDRGGAHQVPPRRSTRSAIDYVEVKGRTKIVVRGQISEYIPNPTFDVVAAPGAQEEYFRNGNPEGKSYREIIGEPMPCHPGLPRAGARLELMDELGVDRALMFPTLASLVEERMKDDPELIHAVIHALNEWMHETWTFDYEDRIFATPVITLADRRQGDRGARVGARARRPRRSSSAPAPVARVARHPRRSACPSSTRSGSGSVRPASSVGMHASDSGYAELHQRVGGLRQRVPARSARARSA